MQKLQNQRLDLISEELRFRGVREEAECKARSEERLKAKEKKLLAELLSKHGNAHGPLTDSK